METAAGNHRAEQPLAETGGVLYLVTLPDDRVEPFQPWIPTTAIMLLKLREAGRKRARLDQADPTMQPTRASASGTMPGEEVAVFPQEIKIAAELRAENGIRIEFGIAARGCRDRGLPSAFSFLQLGFVHQQVDLSFLDRELDAIAVPHQSERAADRGLG
jgi:hypothetical protein